MDLKLPWHCPHCLHHAIITSENFSAGTHYFDHHNHYGPLAVYTVVIVCPNSECCQFELKAQLRPWKTTGPNNQRFLLKDVVRSWTLEPQARIIPFPDYVPEPIRNDYREACLIRELSPKASATLSRRCLQGMIRDFHGIKRARLVEEIEALREKVDGETWDGINAVRKIGNIGAHMEKDIDVVVDVDPKEAELLIQLIEMLVKDWYIARYERATRINALKESASAKDAQKKTTASEA